MNPAIIGLYYHAATSLCVLAIRYVHSFIRLYLCLEDDHIEI